MPVVNESVECYVGVDPSYKNTAVTVLDASFNILYQATLQNMSGSLQDMNLEPYQRIWEFVDAVVKNFKPRMIFVEDMFVGASQWVTMTLFRAQFVVEYSAWLARVPFQRIRPRAWQKYILGAARNKLAGGVPKHLSRKQMESELAVKFTNEHEADSCAITLAGMSAHAGLDYRTTLGLQQPELETPQPPKKPRKRVAKG